MPRDLLPALKAAQRQNFDSFGEYRMDDGNMAEFFAEVGKLRETIDNIHSMVEEVKRKQEEILSAPQTDQKSKQQLEDLTSDIRKNAKQVRTRLQVIQREIASAETTSRSSSADITIRKTQGSTLSQSLARAMNDLSTAQTENRQRWKARLQRQHEIAGRTFTDQDLELMLEEGNCSVFTQGILVDSAEARRTLQEVENRHKDMKNLESSINELHDMFMDVAVLVEDQGEVIHRIDRHVGEANCQVSKGVEETKIAKKYKSSTRKKKIACAGCLAVVVVIVVLVLVLSFV